MTKTILMASAFAFVAFTASAQSHDAQQIQTQPAPKQDARPVPAPAPQATGQQQAAPALNPDLSMKFNQEDHNFGNVPEGPAVTYDFEFKNIGKTPVIISEAHGSCGCTVPTWPKEPVLPGKSAKIAVTYNTQGRPGTISKTVTVTTNVGTKILKISGNVDKKAETPVDNAPAPVEIKH